MTTWSGRVLKLDFRPSRDGMPFANFWPKGAAIRVQKRSVGRVYGGLCGGMCQLSKELWLSGEPIPENASPTDSGFVDRLVSAQVESLGLPGGPLRYLGLQLPPRTTARRKSTAQTLASVRADLAAGRPSCVGLLRALSWSPGMLNKHHVVLAYAMREDPDETTLTVYDPNHPGNDRVRIIVKADSTIQTNQSDPQTLALLAF
ncbi:MAG: hypothetical protein H0T54_04110 [Geodermatophilaceae bacterium]|nr:hypothetical protein [Geodermatophilaceae bacterium]